MHLSIVTPSVSPNDNKLILFGFIKFEILNFGHWGLFVIWDLLFDISCILILVYFDIVDGRY